LLERVNTAQAEEIKIKNEQIAALLERDTGAVSNVPAPHTGPHSPPHTACGTGMWWGGWDSS